ncbi:MAG TPA: DUF2459 domain-containing protein [Candidatus Cybelea sp.]|nr:DUF2459 domain-containing protein [Candidatus Cybelea sp.]
MGAIAVVLCYAAAGFGLGAMPTADPPAAGTVQMAVVANWFHADLIFPVAGEGYDWRDVFGLPSDARYVALGWGDRRFYLETPRLGDLKLSTALLALSGLDDAVVHVTWLADLPDGPDVHGISATPEQAAILAHYAARALVLGADGRPDAVPDRAYGSADAFYPATGHWSPFLTCNEWLARGLREARIRTGRWAPFADGIVRHLSER